MKKKKIELFDVVNTILLLILMVIILYPMYYTVIASLSEPSAVATGKVTWKIIEFTTEAYERVFENKQVWTGYANTIFYTVFGTLLNMVLTIPAAYGLSKKYFPCKKFFMAFFLFTMYFSGGMIPTYFLVKNMGLINTRTVLVILGGISIYNLIVSKSFFMSSIPESLFEAAEIDGAGEFKKFISIALPLSKSICAVMILYYAVAHWNSYFNALLYISDKALEPLQSVLRRILILNQSALNVDLSQLSMEEMIDSARRSYLAYTMKYALVFIASAPLLIAYPFVQKHFVKGTMIGAVKE